MFVSFLPALYLRFLSEIFQNSRFLHLFLTGTHRHWTGTQGHWTGTQRHFRGHFCGTQILPFGTQVLAEDTPGYFGGTQVPSTGTQVLPIVLPSCLTPSPLYLLPDWLLEFLGVFHNFNLIFGLTNTCDGLFGGSVGPVRLLGLLGLKQTCHLGQQPWLGAHLYKGLNGVLQSPVPEARLHQVWSGQPLRKEAESAFKPALLAIREGTAICKRSSYRSHHFSCGEALRQIALTHTYKRASEGSIHGECLQSSKVISSRDTFVRLPACLFSFHLGLFTCVRFTGGLFSMSGCLS